MSGNNGSLLEQRFTRCLFVLLAFCCIAKNTLSAQPDSLNKKRLLLVGGTAAVGYSGLLIGLNEAWYNGYPRTPFHFINDNTGWFQIDKTGHAWSSYTYGLAGIELMKWTGVKRKQAIWIGGLAGTLFQTPIEILDGFSAEWGASPGDLVANSFGSALVIAQELAWDEQRFQLKFSYWPGKYADLRPNMLGSNSVAKVMKDYNAQTYWMSVNPGAFFPETRFPKWLNIAFGYGADGILGAYENRWTDAGGTVHDHTSVPRYRQYYLSLDVHLGQLPVKNPFLKKVLRVANCIKVPAPALMLTSQGRWHFYPVYF